MVLDAVTYVSQFVDAFVGVYILVILLWILASWIRMPYGFNPVLRFLEDVAGPYLRLWRRVLPSFGPLDFSPIAGIFGLIVVDRIIQALLDRLH